MIQKTVKGSAGRGWQAGFSSIWHGRKERFIHDSNCQPGDWIQVGNNILSNIGSAGKPVQEKVIVPSEWEGKRLYCAHDSKLFMYQNKGGKAGREREIENDLGCGSWGNSISNVP